MTGRAVLYLIWGFCVLAFAPAGQACPYPTYYRPSYYSPPYVEKVKVVEVFTPVFVPTFSVSYTAPVAAPPAAASVAAPAAAAPSPVAATPPNDLAAVLAELRRISGRLDRLEAGQGGVSGPDRGGYPPPQGNAGPQADAGPRPAKTRLAVLRASCAACHTAGRLDKDTTLVLLDTQGVEVALSPSQEVQLLRRCYAGTMPPRSNKKGIQPLTDEDFAALASGSKGGVR